MFLNMYSPRTKSLCKGSSHYQFTVTWSTFLSSPSLLIPISPVLHALEALPFEIDTQAALDITMKSKAIPFRNSHQLFNAITQLESRIHSGNTSANFSFKYYEVLQRLYISVAFFIDFPKCVESVILSTKRIKESQEPLSEVMRVVLFLLTTLGMGPILL